MTTNLDTHVRHLDDADLDAVAGGDVRDAAVRVALGVIYNVALAQFGNNEYVRWSMENQVCR